MIYTRIEDIDKKYQIIYADPPWKYDNMKGNNPSMGGITYPVMSIEELCSLPINKITDEDCALFIWVTMPKLEQSFDVINAWGFNYITCAFTWIKTNKNNHNIYSGLGHWVNGNAELCLFAKKGHPKRICKDVKQVVIAPVQTHSMKPKRVIKDIECLMGDIPRIELFSRQEILGWDSFGNEVEPIKKGLF